MMYLHLEEQKKSFQGFEIIKSKFASVKVCTPVEGWPDNGICGRCVMG